jgi:hypothetical protein
MTLKRTFLTILASTVGAIVAYVTLALLGVELDFLVTLGTGGIFLTYVVGTAYWASAKGYNPLLGLFCGWLGPIGWLCLLLCSDQSKQASRA